MDISESLLVSGRLIGKNYRFRNLHHSVAGTSNIRANDHENKARSLIFGNNSFVSFFRGSKYSYDDTSSKRNYSTPAFSKNRHYTDVQAPGLLDLSDAVFFDSETGKELLLNDQVFHESFSVQETNTAGCSSRVFRHQMSAPAILTDFSKNKQKECSTGDEFTEIISSFNNQKKQNCLKPFSNLQSPYKDYREKSLAGSSLDLNEPRSVPLLSFDSERNGLLHVDKPSYLLKFSTPKLTTYNRHSGFAYHKNIHLKSEKCQEEKQLYTDNLFSFMELDKAVSVQSNDSFAAGSGFVMHGSSSGISRCDEQWSIEPQLVMLNLNKGNRVRLLNNSTKNLRFKTVFDFKMTNICPLSGTVPAMNEIGLRIVISPYSRKLNENFKGDIKVIIGKNEKSIHVQFCRGEKLKCFK